MVLIYFKKARSAKTWILHLNPEDGKSQHPNSTLPAFGWKERSPDRFSPLMPTARGHDGKARPQLRLGSPMPSQRTAL